MLIRIGVIGIIRSEIPVYPITSVSPYSDGSLHTPVAIHASTFFAPVVAPSSEGRPLTSQSPAVNVIVLIVLLAPAVAATAPARVTVLVTTSPTYPVGALLFVVVPRMLDVHDMPAALVGSDCNSCPVVPIATRTADVL